VAQAEPPATTRPAHAEPVDATVDAEPVDAEPVDSEPVDAEPVDAEPVDVETVDLIDAALVRLVRRITDRRTTDLLNTWAGVDIERSGFTLLARLEQHRDARLAELATAADIDVSTASRQMARLLEQGLVSRRTDPSNHRAFRHRLTAQGAAALARLRRARRTWIADSVVDFATADQAQLADLLTRFSDNLQEQSDRQPSPAQRDADRS